MKKSLLVIIIGFLVLFALYHAAEYMIVFKNSPIGFLGFQIVFFVAAYFIAKWQFQTGLQAWGLATGKRFLQHLFAGILVGISLYGLTFLISIFARSEKIIQVPSFTAAIGPFSLFVFGNFFSSFSEDILTRGYIYKHLNGRVGNFILVIISATVYLLNHIYRFANGIETQLYLFMLGVLFIIPLLRTKRLWFTGGMHWGGNCTFFLTHEVFKTESGDYHLSPNYILVLCILLFIPFNFWLLSRFKFSKTS